MMGRSLRYIAFPKYFFIQKIQWARELEKQYSRETTKIEGFWVSASDSESKIQRQVEIVAGISLSEYHGDFVEWQRTAEGRELTEQVLAWDIVLGRFSIGGYSLELDGLGVKFWALAQ